MKLWIVSSIFAALAGFCDGIECEFCKKEFTLLGRHRWRCKARVNTDSIDLDERQVINSYHATRAFEINHDFIGENASIANTKNVVNGEESENALQEHNDPHRFTCYCGKKCKRLRGLKTYQRSCHVVDIPNIKELFEMQDEYVSEESDEERNEEKQINHVKERVLKGIKLPKNKDQWNVANDFFKVALQVNDLIKNIDDSVQTLQRIIYNYFKSNYSNVGSIIEEFSNTYDNMSRNQLKKALKQLKERNDSPEKEIVQVKIRKKGNKSDVFKQELKFRKNFWKFCKSNLEMKKDQTGVSTFDEKKCYDHFRNTCKAKHRKKTF